MINFVARSFTLWATRLGKSVLARCSRDSEMTTINRVIRVLYCLRFATTNLGDFVVLFPRLKVFCLFFIVCIAMHDIYRLYRCIVGLFIYWIAMYWMFNIFGNTHIATILNRNTSMHRWIVTPLLYGPLPGPMETRIACKKHTQNAYFLCGRNVLQFQTLTFLLFLG